MTTRYSWHQTKLQKKLNLDKANEIAKDKEYISDVIENEILNRYYYKEGTYKNKLINDKVILKALKVLKNREQYSKILRGA